MLADFRNTARSADAGDAAGFRRSTPAVRAAARLADGFKGLPDGVTRWRLAAALRAAARPLGLTGPMLRLLELYIDLTYDIDWTVGSEPVVCRPLVEIAEHLGRTERQVRNIERALLDRGLLAFRDSGNHHRKGRRDRRTGRLLYAYGPSLAPVGQRAAEIIAMAAEARAAMAAGRRSRIAIAALRRHLRAGIAAAVGHSMVIDDIIADVDAVPATRAGMSAEAVEAVRLRLGALVAALDQRLENNSFSKNIAAIPEILEPSNTGTTTDKSINEYCTPLEIREIAAPHRINDADVAPISRSAIGMSRIPVTLALAAAGAGFRAAVIRSGLPGWRGLIEGAAERAVLCGVDSACWGEACRLLGRDAAALCLLIVDRRIEDGSNGVPIRSPRAYFNAMVQRAREGVLHVDRSIRALSKQADGTMGAEP